MHQFIYSDVAIYAQLDVYQKSLIIFRSHDQTRAVYYSEVLRHTYQYEKSKVNCFQGQEVRERKNRELVYEITQGTPARRPVTKLQNNFVNTTWLYLSHLFWRIPCVYWRRRRQGNLYQIKNNSSLAAKTECISDKSLRSTHSISEQFYLDCLGLKSAWELSPSRCSISSLGLSLCKTEGLRSYLQPPNKKIEHEMSCGRLPWVERPHTDGHFDPVSWKNKKSAVRRNSRFAANKTTRPFNVRFPSHCSPVLRILVFFFFNDCIGNYFLFATTAATTSVRRIS